MTKKKAAVAPLGCIGIVADLHLDNYAQHGGRMVGGLNQRGMDSLAVLRKALQVAKREGVKVLFVGGDFFNKRRPEPALIAGAMHALAEEAANLGVVIIPGNHDMLDTTAAEGNTALAPLFNEATVINQPSWFDVPEVGVSLLCVPFQAQEPMRDYLPKVLAELGQVQTVHAKRALITHVGVYSDDDPGPANWKAKAGDAIAASAMFAAMSAGRILDCFVGNFHHAEQWRSTGVDGEMTITQTGTLCPHTFSDDGVFPKVGALVLYDGATVRMVEVEGPRFLPVETDIALAAAEQRVATHAAQTYVRLGVEFANRQTRLELKGAAAVELAAPKEADPEGLSALPQVADAKEAIALFINEMRLPDGVKRDDVHAAALAVWNAQGGA